MSQLDGRHGRISPRPTGFTLIEMIITVVILSIVAGTGVTAITSAFNAITTAQAIAPMSQTGQIIMERLIMELRNANCPDLSYPAGTGTLQWIDSNNRTVKVHQAGTNAIYLTYNNDNVNWLLGSDVKAASLQFNLKTCDGAGQPAPAKPGLVTFSFTMSRTLSDGQTITLPFKTAVYVRSS